MDAMRSSRDLCRPAPTLPRRARKGRSPLRVPEVRRTVENELTKC